MYALNGFNLDENGLDGHLTFASRPYQGIARRSNSFSRGPVDGYVSVAWQNDATTMLLVERLPEAGLRAFEALLDSKTLVLQPTANPSIEAEVELLSAPVDFLETADPMVDVHCLLRVNGVYWRSVAEVTSTAAAISSASTTVTVAAFAGISAPIQDAIYRIAGSITGVRVTDSGGTWWEYPTNLPTGSYLRFESGSGPGVKPRAFVTTTNTWTGGTEVTGLLKKKHPRLMELTPYFPVPSDPTQREVRLTVTSSARSGSPTIEVRGKNAHLV